MSLQVKRMMQMTDVPKVERYRIKDIGESSNCEKRRKTHPLGKESVETLNYGWVEWKLPTPHLNSLSFTKLVEKKALIQIPQSSMNKGE